MFICMQKINLMTHFFFKILQRNSNRGIQLLRSHLLQSKYKICKSGDEEARVSANIHLQIFEKLIQTFKKKKEYRNGQELWLKVEKDREQHKKTIT